MMIGRLTSVRYAFNPHEILDFKNKIAICLFSLCSLNSIDSKFIIGRINKLCRGLNINGNNNNALKCM